MVSLSCLAFGTFVCGSTAFAQPADGPGKSLFELAADSPHTALADIKDGTANTVLAGMVSEGRSVPWTKPDDLVFDDTFQMKDNAFVEGAVLFADGSVRHLQIQEGLIRDKFRALFTIAGAEPNPLTSLYPPDHKSAPLVYKLVQDQVRQAEARSENKNSLKSIGLAFYNYHQTTKHFPPAVVYGPDGKPWHSWRVLILPFLDQVALYQRYDSSVPWDHPKNAAVLAAMPKVYRDPLSDKPDSNKTRYLLVTGVGTAFPTKPAGKVVAQAPAPPNPAQPTPPKPVPKDGREPIDYQPFFLQAWQKARRTPKFYAWEGEKVVLLTTTADLDPKTIGVFLKRLDAAWTFCSDITGYSPPPYKQHKGKPTIAAIPDPSLMINQAVFGGFTAGGGEVSTFDGPNGDYERVRKAPEQFPTSYFQIIAQNHYGVSQSCLAFNEGAGLVLRRLCVEDAKLKDDDPKTRHSLDQAAEAYAKSNLSIGTSFPHLIGSQPIQLNDLTGQPLPPTTIGMLLGSIVLKLREERGGNEWLKKFYRQLSTCPATVGLEKQFVQAQLLNFTIAASLASQSDPTKDFKDRWRFPLDVAVWAALKEVDWKKPGLTANDVIDALPSEHLLPSVVQLRPSFLTPERREQNLLVAGNFEGDAGQNWKPTSWRKSDLKEGGTGTIEGGDVHEGQKAAVLRTDVDDDLRMEQSVKLQPGTRYLLSGWIKTKNVVIQKFEQNVNVGASLSLWGGYEHTQSITGTQDWTYVTLIFDSRDRTEVPVLTRLGYWFCLVTGEAWYDDLCLIPLGPSPVRPTPSAPTATSNLVTNKDWKGWSKDAPAPAIAPFDAAQAKQHQEAWAKHLGVPVEYTNSIGMKFRLIPPGEYLRGCSPEELSAGLKVTDPYWAQFLRTSGPQHKVILTQPFYLGVYEVTQESYSQVMGNNPAHFSPTGPGRGVIADKETGKFPVERVSWNDAVDFCARLSVREKLKPPYSRTSEVVTLLAGNGYRLPTEGEWEFACRAGTTTTFWNGNSVDQYSQVGRNYFPRTPTSRTHAVGELKPNPFGLFDVYGNVWEYAQDNWTATTYSQLANGVAVDPVMLPSGNIPRVIRGGSYMDVPPTSTSGSHLAQDPTNRGLSNIGFRAALSVDAVKAALAKPVQAEAPLVEANSNEPLTLKGHSDGVYRVAFSPDGTRLASAGGNGSLKLWDSANGQETLAMKGHVGWVLGIAFGPEGKQLVSCGTDRTVRVWDTATGQESLSLKANGVVLGVAMSVDGQRIAAATTEPSVKVWDASGKELLTLKGHTAAVTSVAWSADGKWLASAGRDQSVKTWDAASGKERLTLKGHAAEITSVAISPDGKWLASGSHDQAVKQWDAASGQLIRTLQGHGSGVMSVAFSGNGQRLASASGDQTVKVWDAASGHEQFTLKGHVGQVLCATWNSDGTRLATGSYDRTVKVWEIPSATKPFVVTPAATIFPVTPAETEHFNEAVKTSRSLTNGNFAAGLDGWQTDGGAKDFRTFPLGTVKGLTTFGSNKEATTGRLYQCFRIPDDAIELQFSIHGGADSQKTYVALRNGKFLVRRAIAKNDNTPFRVSWNVMSLRGTVVTLEIVDESPFAWGFIGAHGFTLTRDKSAAATSKVTPVPELTDGQQLLTLKGHFREVMSVSFSPDGKQLVSGSDDKSVKLWDATTGKETLTLNGHTARVMTVTFSADGKRVASGGYDKLAKVWDATSGKEVTSVTATDSYLTSVAFSPDGQRFASAGVIPAKVWDTATGKELLDLKGHGANVNCVVFSPDGKQLASASHDMTIKLRDSATGQERLSLKGHLDAVTSVAFSPDGKWLASASHDQTVKVWDVASGQEKLTLIGHTSYVTGVAISPDGKRIASVSWDSTVRLWDSATGQELLTIKGHSHRVNGIAFSPDSKQLATASDDRTVKLWDITRNPNNSRKPTASLPLPQKSLSSR
jgi:WD40 repeat protein